AALPSLVAHRPVWSGPRLVEPGELLANPPELRLDLLVVERVREVREVALPVGQATVEVTQAAPGDPAIAPLASRFRGQHEDPVDDGHDLAPLLATPVDPLEVGEHADQELALR